MRALESLADAEDNDILKNALLYFRRNEKLSPRYAFVVFWRLQENRIDHDPSFFRASLQRHKHQADLREMPTDRMHMFSKALTSAQRKWPSNSAYQTTKRDPKTAAAFEDLKRRVEEARKPRV